MEITIEELLKGKATKIKKNDYFPTAAYVEPFLERMSKFTNDFRVQVKLPDQVTKTIDGEINTDDITYNRVWVQAVMPDEYTFDNHSEVVGMVYGLESETPLDYRCIKHLMEQTNDLKVWLEKLHNTTFPYKEDEISLRTGQWLRNTITQQYDNGYGKVKLATSSVVDAYKMLYLKEDSPYYIKPGEDIDMFTVYNAFTQLITDDSKDIVNKVEKTLLLKDILNF